MKITNLAAGEEYSLMPATKIEVERTNPFFNDYGERTVPLDLPTSARNRRILGFPETFGGMHKIKPMDVSIQDGEFYTQCRQVVLNAQHEGQISTSFFLNDGSFNSKIKNVRLKDVFKDEFVPGVNSVKEGIEFCRRLRNNEHEQFAIFPILVEDDSGVAEGYNFKILNAFGRDESIGGIKIWAWTPKGPGEIEVPVSVAFKPDLVSGDSDFYNACQRTEYVNNVSITLKEGYYITPFIRSNYVLQRVFAYFGYELLPNFFTETVPFDKMVILNNVIDTLVNGRIRIADLVPNITCSEFLSVYRKKFNCEFTPNEGNRTVDVVFLRDVMASPPTADLTHCMTAEPVITYKSDKDYRRITLAADTTLGSEATESYNDLNDMSKANANAYFEPKDGSFYKIGFSGDFRLITKIGEASQDYNTGEELEAKEIKIPEIIPEFRCLQYIFEVGDDTKKYDMGNYLFVGKYQTLNSKMVVAGNDKETDTESAGTEKTMLAFCAFREGRTIGTISPYDHSSSDWKKNVKLFDYALYYNGDNGIFSKFYKDYDLLLRNALHELKVMLRLTQSQKQNLPATGKVLIRGVAFFINKLKFVLGGKNEPMESELYSVSLMHPIVSVPAIDYFFPTMQSEYEWVGKFEITEISKDDYNNAGSDQDRSFVTQYPPVPTEQYLGGKYFVRRSARSRKTRHKSFWRSAKYKYTCTTVWLECHKRD